MYFTHWIKLHVQENSLPRLSETHAQWMFVLLAQVEDHISADSMSLLRSLVRACLTLLKVIIKEQADTVVTAPGPDMKSPDGVVLISQTSCWMVISAIVEIWGQRDLWMDAEDMLRSIGP